MTVIGTVLYEDAYITQPSGQKKLKITNKHILRQTFDSQQNYFSTITQGLASLPKSNIRIIVQLLNLHCQWAMVQISHPPLIKIR
jgi:hypothetical protein